MYSPVMQTKARVELHTAAQTMSAFALPGKWRIGLLSTPVALGPTLLSATGLLDTRARNSEGIP